MAATDSPSHGFYGETVASSRPCRGCPFYHAYACTMAITQGAADFVASALGVPAAIIIAMRVHCVASLQISPRELVTLSLGAGLVSLLLQDGQRSKRFTAGLPRIHATQEAIRIAMPASLALLPAGPLPDCRGLLGAVLVALFVMPILLILENQLLLSIDGVLRSGVCSTGPDIVHEADNTAEPLPATPRGPMSMGLRPVVAATPGHFHTRVVVMATAVQRSTAKVEFLTGPLAHDSQQPISMNFAGLMVRGQDHATAPWGYPIIKRIMDIVLSSILLFLLAPVLLLIALVISLDSPGPAVFVQRRVGLGGKLFGIYKFRTMHLSVPRYELSPTSSRDPRITRVGKLLRRTSLDELPQFLNVLSGDMSLVGPRPEMPFVVDKYNALQRQRLEVAPGITGLWQLSADRSTQIHENLHYDLNYIRNRTISLDLAILTHTLFFAMRGI